MEASAAMLVEAWNSIGQDEVLDAWTLYSLKTVISSFVQPSV
jgi:hypothetical protein